MLISTAPKTHTLTSEDYLYGDMSDAVDKGGYKALLLALGAIIALTVIVSLHWPEMLFVTGYVALMFIMFGFSDHFRIDGLRASANGLDLTYSHIGSYFGGDYTNERVMIPWSDVNSVVNSDDEEGDGRHYVNIALVRELKCGISSLSLYCANEIEASRVRTCILSVSLSGRK
jgi:hypothetical protein